MVTNYEHGNFSVSQCKTGNLTKDSLVPIPAASPTVNPPIVPVAAPSSTHATKAGLSQETKAGIIAGSIAAALLIFLMLGMVLWTWRSRLRKRRTSSLDKSQIHYVFEKQELDGTAFTRHSQWNTEKKAELMNVEVVELPNDPVIHEIMSRPRKSWIPKKRRPSHKRTYTAYINIKKARENRMSNGKVSPPISKFCSISCAPVKEKLINLNRTLPPTPVFRSPRVSGPPNTPV